MLRQLYKYPEALKHFRQHHYSTSQENVTFLLKQIYNAHKWSQTHFHMYRTYMCSCTHMWQCPWSMHFGLALSTNSYIGIKYNEWYTNAATGEQCTKKLMKQETDETAHGLESLQWDSAQLYLVNFDHTDHYFECRCTSTPFPRIIAFGQQRKGRMWCLHTPRSMKVTPALLFSIISIVYSCYTPPLMHQVYEDLLDNFNYVAGVVPVLRQHVTDLEVVSIRLLLLGDCYIQCTLCNNMQLTCKADYPVEEQKQEFSYQVTVSWNCMKLCRLDVPTNLEWFKYRYLQKMLSRYWLLLWRLDNGLIQIWYTPKNVKNFSEI